MCSDEWKNSEVLWNGIYSGYVHYSKCNVCNKAHVQQFKEEGWEKSPCLGRWWPGERSCEGEVWSESLRLSLLVSAEIETPERETDRCVRGKLPFPGKNLFKCAICKIIKNSPQLTKLSQNVKK